MGSVDYRALAPQILEKVGGEVNIISMAHCATRLRLNPDPPALIGGVGVA